ncbi:MAG: hypothetical protein KGY99_04640 [Phycisphaerae bacterium]|nr:hypothetical protein [Phycisphaerae bacterium]
MEHSEGLARRAEVWVDGHLLVVCDNISARERPVTPGPLESVRFTYVPAEGFSWSEAVRGNPSRRKRLDPVRDWSYVGYGRVMDIMPVAIDFGLLRMEDATWTDDESLTGRYVRIPIDRLELHRSGPP